MKEIQFLSPVFDSCNQMIFKLTDSLISSILGSE